MSTVDSRAAAEYIGARLKEHHGDVPEIAIVLGSGLGALTEQIEQPLYIRYEEIPDFLQPSVSSHAGFLCIGKLCGRQVAVMSGRSHYYEGHSMDRITFYVPVLRRVGVKTLILTNAAGGVDPSFRTGDLMLITDHIKLCADSPGRGDRLADMGNRFVDMSRTYTPALQEAARRAAQKRGIALKEGVYFYMTGPQFETPAEVRMIHALGGAAVGMSTVPEAIAAAYCGMRLLGVSCITNMAAGVLPDTTISDDEVVVNAAEASERFIGLIHGILEEQDAF